MICCYGNYDDTSCALIISDVPLELGGGGHVNTHTHTVTHSHTRAPLSRHPVWLLLPSFLLGTPAPPPTVCAYAYVCPAWLFSPRAPRGGMAPCWRLLRTHLLYDNYPRHPSAWRGGYLPPWGHTYANAHTHYITAAHRCWFSAFGSLYTRFTLSLCHTPLCPCCRWDEPPGTRSSAFGCCGVLRQWRISVYERRVTLASGAQTGCVPCFRFIIWWCNIRHVGKMSGGWATKHNVYGHLLARVRHFKK